MENNMSKVWKKCCNVDDLGWILLERIKNLDNDDKKFKKIKEKNVNVNLKWVMIIGVWKCIEKKSRKLFLDP